MGTAEDFLATARTATELLRAPAVAAAWAGASALSGFTVGGLAAHLAQQVHLTARVLAEPEPDEEVVPLLEHFNRARWINATLDDQSNQGILAAGERDAAGGPEELLARVDAALAELPAALGTARSVRMPTWGPYALSLDDFLMTRLMELTVHSDDLAVSVGVPTPTFAPEVVDPVLALLTRLSLRRHGATALLRALTRAERAPDTIAAF
ncbi:maleylpyruvate isomerase N-terminal domain-containing protein [Actinokineospora sp. NBRC 105648]|uniref:maleylpyruvate isomerase N-terminal domain-containing protein n=1 Tax=Actinokineospora sp. NBRC 105648 TaxID=3032206 RepID=UPI00249FD5AF|nr:maleylpyruvate isomerase N-terminal domain-containing protein [Actinokineospora sp. NBRC 105648]GLZ43061.1 hypothetical protein Acsp05_66850 [Actinokineospora sp. NBRC 105648]